MTFHEMIFGRKPGQVQRFFDASNDQGGGDDAAKKAAEEAAKKAAEEAAAAEAAAKQAAAEEAAKKAAEEAAKKAAANPGDADAQKLAEEKAQLLREVMEKKSAIKELQEQLKAFDGIDPAKVREMLKKEADAERAAAEAKGDFERVKQMMAEEHAKEVKTVQEQLEEMRKAAAEKDSVIDRLTIGNDFSGSSYIRDDLVISPAKARTLYGAHFEVKDGVTVAYDKPAGAANRTMMVDSAGRPLGFDAAFKRIVEADPEAKSLMKAKITPGGGSKTDPSAAKKTAVRDDSYGAARIVKNLADL